MPFVAYGTKDESYEYTCRLGGPFHFGPCTVGSHVCENDRSATWKAIQNGTIENRGNPKGLLTAAEVLPPSERAQQIFGTSP